MTEAEAHQDAARLSCKECYRRKARCDKVVPTCGPCVRYRRHCLYEKHSRTPLTRKHLTEVEEKLERAEAVIRRLRQNDGSSTRYPANVESHQTGSSEDSSHQTFEAREALRGSIRPQTPTSTSTSSAGIIPPAQNPAEDDEPRQSRLGAQISLLPGSVASAFAAPESSTSKATAGLLETPPQDDFEWNELGTVNSPTPGTDAVRDGEDEGQIKDGMASLSVKESEAGYLGVASGAALLRMLEPDAGREPVRQRLLSPPLPSVLAQPDVNRHIADTMIDSYFSSFHLSYPILHEPTFRAQYSEVIPQPHGRSWTILAYTVASIGVYCSAVTVAGDLDLQLSVHARSMLSFDFLEVGNLTLVQTLTLMSNYQQKRNKPNSGYNYLGLASRMAMGLGLHKEFPGWNISPLNMEIRRRVWWSLCVFEVGATITFSRPMVWPYDGVDVAFPLNVADRELTANSRSYPPENTAITPYTAVGIQARFHMATHKAYSKVISRPFPSAEELGHMDATLIKPWLCSLPNYFDESSSVPQRYALPHAVMQWRYRNFRIIMYRPFVIRNALNTRQGRVEESAASIEAYERCLEDARFTIYGISNYWANNERNRLAAWYSLYFLFQAALIPCICLRNCPFAPEALSWSDQISTTLRTIEALSTVNASSVRCYQVIQSLCGQYLKDGHPASLSRQPYPSLPHETISAGQGPEATFSNLASDAAFDFAAGEDPGPINESPQTQINQVFPMMWPNATALEAVEEVMGQDAWVEFLKGTANNGGPNGAEQADIRYTEPAEFSTRPPPT
ncbi:Uu.00g104570.m01.CDS01 [Anthostomella pinea]|uniref:Uu.00g104570.m01.CDS01 n=1 Tax=Anthostomella pinea TaxID=933095 RepID=A0AAI8VDU3_9PEZI|nr:Uu.00g104570.m01.CDS01 [Anthostomella pinea]